MRYIDADKILYTDLSEGRGVCWVTFMDWIKEMPTADVRENIRGEWIPHRLISREYIGTILVNVSYDYWFCDTCGYRVEDGQPMYNFCPNCGAEMRGEDNGRDEENHNRV